MFECCELNNLTSTPPLYLAKSNNPRIGYNIIYYNTTHLSRGFELECSNTFFYTEHILNTLIASNSNSILKSNILATYILL